MGGPMYTTRLLNVAFCLFALHAMWADAQTGGKPDSPQTLAFRTEEPIEIPGGTLDPGAYVLRLRSDPKDPYVAQILNLVEVLEPTQTRVVASLHTLQDYRSAPGDTASVTYYPSTAGHHKALKAWMRTTANSNEYFVYPREQAVEIGRRTLEVVLTMPLAAPAERREPPPAPAAAPQAVTPQQEAERAAPRRLPATAGYLPIAAWLGLAALAALFLIKAYRRDPASVLNARNDALARKVAAAAYQSYKLAHPGSTDKQQ